jgi:hypothetical protein
VTTDSQTSEEDPLPPSLPPKHGRDSTDGSGLHSLEESQCSHARMSSGSSYQFSNRPLPPTPESQHYHDHSGHYEVLEIKNREVIQSFERGMKKKSAPIPPPKPSRNSKNSMSP